MALKSLNRKFQRRYQKKIAAEAKGLRELFESLVSLDHGVKRRLGHSVRRDSNLMAAANVWTKDAFYAVMIPTALLGYIWLFGSLDLAGKWLHVSYSTLAWIGVFFLYAIVLCLEMALLFPFYFAAILLKSRQPVRYLVSTALQWVWGCAVLTGYLVFSYRVLGVERTGHPGLLVFLIMSGILATVGYFAVVGVLSTAVVLLVHALERRKSSLYPDAFMVTQLVSIVSLVERGSTKWATLDFKRRLMREIELAAICIERDLTRQLRAGDVATNAWLRDRGWQIAAALRDLKKWISTPMWDTRARLVEELSRNLICAASGDWDGLSRSMPEKLTGSQVRTGLLMIARLLLAGALPALALWGLQSTHFRLQGEIYHYAVFGVSLWGLISLLSAFDPTFSTKASAITDMAKNFLPGKK